jgi:hypothetical protein
MFCDESAVQQTWATYTHHQAGTSVLKELQALNAELGRHVTLAELGALIAGALAARAKSPTALDQASNWVLRDFSNAKSDAQRQASAEQSLQQAIEAAGLSITPDDLTTEGGLKAATKLANAMLKAAERRWQQAFASWVKCLQAAAAAGQLAKSDREEAETCNAGPTSPDAQVHEGWKRVFEWQSHKQARAVCQRANRSRELVVVRFQSKPCDSGMSF